MIIKLFSAFLLALTVLCSALSCALAQTTDVAAQEPPFPVHLLDAQQVPGVVNPTYLTESLWLSSHQVINVQSGTSNLVLFDAETGQQTTLDLVNTLAKHQEEYYDEFAIRTSPDGRWLLWPSGSKAKPTWVALSLDGQEHHEWPRVTRIGAADIAWMQDSRHWVELDEVGTEFGTPTDVPRRTAFKARVYDTASPQVTESPLVPEASNANFSLPMQGASGQFTFTKDGHAWVSKILSGSDPQFPFRCSFLTTYELKPGLSAWTLHISKIILGSEATVGSSDECVRSPDDNWLIWRNYAPDGKGPMRLVLTRPDGSNAQVIHTSPGGQNLSYIHWTPDSQHVAFYQNNGMYRIALNDVKEKAGHSSPLGSFPTSSP